MQENNELSSMSQRPRLSSSITSHNFRRLLLSYNDDAIKKKMQKKFPGVAENWYLIAQGYGSDLQNFTLGAFCKKLTTMTKYNSFSSLYTDKPQPANTREISTKTAIFLSLAAY